MYRFKLTIDGKPVDVAQHAEVLNPASGEPIGMMPMATDAILNDAVAAARKAFPAWSRKSDAERKAICHQLGKVLEDNAEELAQILTAEQGKTLNGVGGSRFEMGGAIAWTHATADLDLPVEVIQDTPEGRVEIHRKPIGVVGSITPWNYPVMIGCWHVIPALRAGNTVVIKPSPQTPLATIRMVELFNQVLPPGVLNVVSGDNSIGAALSRHPGVDKMTFTGSTQTGKKIMASAVETLKRLTLELGGNDAGIVLPDADPKAIAGGLFWGAFINTGQTCAALKRLYVHDSIYDQVCEELAAFTKTIPLGEGTDEAAMVGPVQNEMQFNKVVELVEDAKEKGGRILTGGHKLNRKGYFYPITLVADATDDMRLVQEEQFGPALPIVRYSSVEDVLKKANDSEFGLGASVWSSNPAEAKKIALQMESGSVWINKHGAIQPNAPFGGVKGSGVGVEFGPEGLKEFTLAQTVFI